MRTFFLKVSYVGVALCLVGLPGVQAAEIVAEISATPGAASPSKAPLVDSIDAAAARWAKELDRLAFALEERALVEEGDDADIQALLTRAEHLKMQRAHLQECSARRHRELSLALRRSVEGIPEAASAERDSVMAVIGRPGVDANRGPYLTGAPGEIR